MSKTKRYFCKRAKDVDWSKLNLKPEVYELTKDFNHASLIDRARVLDPDSIRWHTSYLKNKIRIALKRRDGVSGKLTKELEEYYEDQSAKITTQIRTALEKAGFIRSHIDTYWLEQCQDLVALCYYSDIELYKEKVISSFIKRKRGYSDAYRTGARFNALMKLKKRLDGYKWHVIYGTRKGYETYDPDVFARVYHAFIQYLSPAEKLFIGWWRNKPSFDIVLTEEEIDTLNCCYANFVLNVERIEATINKLIP